MADDNIYNEFIEKFTEMFENNKELLEQTLLQYLLKSPTSFKEEIIKRLLWSLDSTIKECVSCSMVLDDFHDVFTIKILFNQDAQKIVETNFACSKSHNDLWGMRYIEQLIRKGIESEKVK